MARASGQHSSSGDSPRPIGPETPELEFPVVSPDGARVAAAAPEEGVFLVPLDGSGAVAVPGVEPGEMPIQWSADGRSVFVYRPDEIPARLFRVDVADGRRQLVREFDLDDPTGLDFGGLTIAINPDATAYAYSFARALHNLDLVEGLR